jgi:eukaryotic-like serine/threonine-protein kinase
MIAREPQAVRFGDYVADFRRRELRRDGMRVRIQGKPLAVLAVLMESPGEIVAREELRKRLWPDDVFVDFDKNLATAVNKLRSALCDTAARSRYIETVPRLGYRLIPPVEVVDPAPAIAAAEPATAPAPAAVQTPTAVAVPAVRPAKRRPLWAPMAAAILLAGIAIQPSEVSTVRQTGMLSGRAIVVGDFANSTGDKVFDGALRQGLMAELEQSHTLNLLSDAQIGETLDHMERPRSTYLSAAVSREICTRSGGAAAIAGSISTFGKQYLLNVRAEGCRDGELLGQVQATAESKENVLGALGDAALRLRGQLGESLQSLKGSDRTPAAVTTASLEALQAYGIGERILLVENNSHPAIPFFKRAIGLDPNFAMAWARLGRCYDSEEEEGLAAESFTRAHELRSHASEREDLYIDAYYQYIVQGDLEAAARSFRTWAETFPSDYTPHASLGNIYNTLGKFEEALAEREAALRLDPGVGLNYGNLVSTLVGTHRFDQAREVAAEAKAHNLDSPEIHLVMAWVAWLEAKPGLHDELLKPVLSDPLVEQWALKDDALIAAYEGRFATARELEREALDGYHRIDRAQAGWVHVAEAGVREGLVGNMGRAREDAHEALDHDRSREVRGRAAVALALAGDTQEASRMADELAAQYPQATIVQRHYLPAIRGAMALGEDRPNDALQALEPAEAYELGIMGEVGLPLYLRGEAYLGLKDGQRAADAFTKLIRDCPYPGTFPCALARLELARAYAMQGDTGKARSAYNDFFALWKQADRDIPLLKPARLELSRLNTAGAAVARLQPVN